MSYVPDNPLIVQSDLTLLLEVQSPRYPVVRDALLAFAELVKSPEYVHTWRLTDLSLWNAAAAGHDADSIIDTLERFAKYPVPSGVPERIRSVVSRYGALRLVQDGEYLRLEADEPLALEEVRHLKDLHDLLGDEGGVSAGAPLRGPGGVSTGVRVHPRRRGELKRLLVANGHPVEDLVGYEDGDALDMQLTSELPTGPDWSIRDYQLAAVDSFTTGPSAGSGVVVLPCGAGKTVVGIAAMVRLGMRTLVLCTGHVALQQWKREILERTTLTEADVGEYSGRSRQLRNVTLTTYQLLTWRREKGALPAHFGLFFEANWGLVIYDEVHLLPAPIFREAAGLQARRRLGLTATLVREDGLEGDVFALIGPKRYDVPWKQLEHQGWIASARCVEVRVPLSTPERLRYVKAGATAKFMIASKNARKGAVMEKLMKRHAGEPTLVLGAWLDQLEFVARRFKVPLVTGKTPPLDRERMFQRFRSGEIKVLALSKVGNFAIDLPSAAVGIQISGTWGSRQEEAQRLGRLLRPKEGDAQAVFYSLVTSDSREQEVAERRQLFLAEQGYPYRIEQAS